MRGPFMHPAGFIGEPPVPPDPPEEPSIDVTKYMGDWLGVPDDKIIEKGVPDDKIPGVKITIEKGFFWTIQDITVDEVLEAKSKGRPIRGRSYDGHDCVVFPERIIGVEAVFRAINTNSIDSWRM